MTSPALATGYALFEATKQERMPSVTAFLAIKFDGNLSVMNLDSGVTWHLLEENDNIQRDPANPWGRGRVGVLNFFFHTGKLHPEVQTPTLSHTIFVRRGNFFIYLQ